jgi:hypothetical protein
MNYSIQITPSTSKMPLLQKSATGRFVVRDFPSLVPGQIPEAEPWAMNSFKR